MSPQFWYNFPRASLHSSEQFNVLLVPRAPKLNRVFQVRPHQRLIQGQHYSRRFILKVLRYEPENKYYLLLQADLPCIVCFKSLVTVSDLEVCLLYDLQGLPTHLACVWLLFLWTKCMTLRLLRFKDICHFLENCTWIARSRFLRWFYTPQNKLTNILRPRVTN